MNFKKTYRYIIALVFATLFFAETFYCVFVVAGYYADTGAYAANCINKNQPQMHCNGKCQLQKKMDDVDKKDKNPERKNESGFSVLSSKSFFASIGLTDHALIKQQYFIFNSGIPIDNSFQFFHPPKSFFI